MDIASFARKMTNRIPLLAYLLIPASKAVDRFRKFGLHDRVEENIHIFCTPEQLADSAYMRRLRRDIWYSVIRYNCAPVEYFLYDFAPLNHAGRQEFVCSWEGSVSRKKLNEANPEWTVFAGKYNTYLRFKDYYKREIILLNNEMPDELFYSFVAAHPRFVVKPYFSAGGDGVHFEDTSNTPPGGASGAVAPVIPSGIGGAHHTERRDVPLSPSLC